MLTKKELRAEISARKKQYTVEERKQKSIGILEQLKKTEEFRSARSVLCYWSMADEVFTHEFVPEIAHEKRVFLPVVSGDILLIREFTEESCLVEGASFSIPEPGADAEEVTIDQIDLVVVPGVAFDLKGGRLGRGKGFYDKLLGGADIYKIAVCFDFQVVSEVPRDDFDVLMDKVIFG